MPEITMAQRFTPGKGLSLLLAALFLSFSSYAAAHTNALPGADIFDNPNIVRISITIPDAGMSVLRRYHFNGTLSGDKPEANATVSDGSRIYKDVAVQLKGAAGSFSRIDQRPSLTLKFDKNVKGQTFHGLEKISLNNSVQDPTYINEKISRELFQKAGIPVPRSDYALVTLNGKSLGLYVLVEGFNKQFLKRYFKNVSGNLYDGGFCQEITAGPLNVNSGDKPQDQTDLDQLAEAASKARQNNRLAELSKVLDTDRFVTMIAMEVLLCHWDGYAMNRNNYRVFSDKESGKMVFMPHGMDQVLGIGGMGSPHTPIFPQMNGMIARTYLGTSEGRSKYRMKLMELRTNLFDVAAITARVREIEARLRPVRRVNANDLCRNIAIRGENIDQQLGAPTGELKFDKNGIARLDGWRPRNPANGGRYDRMTGPDGSALLFLQCDPGKSSVSWRTRAVLPKGLYRFEGRVRTKALPNSPGMGATLRISGARQVPMLQGETDWADCTFEFEVEEEIADIEVVCEVRGAGSAWFDAGSLRVVRLNPIKIGNNFSTPGVIQTNNVRKFAN
jgi:spore coat protein H